MLKKEPPRLTHLKSRYERLIQTEQYLNMDCVRDTWENVNTCLAWIESEIGRNQYMHIEEAIMTALTVQELSGFMVGYTFAIPAHRR